MSSPRAQKQFQAMPDQLKRLGGYTFDINGVLRWQGRVGTNDLGLAGYDACVLDLDATVWADNARRVLIVAVPAQDKNGTAAMKTQSHAAGMYLDGSYSFKCYVETPESWTGEQARWERILMQHLVGQLAAPVELLYCANDTEPTLQGVNGVTAASASFTTAGTYLPYGMTYPGGV